MFCDSNCCEDQKEICQRSNKTQYQNLCKITITEDAIVSAYFVFALESYSLHILMLF